MAGKPLPVPPLDRLRELFSYDPENGILIRRMRRGGETAGRIVGTANSHGHLVCRVDYRMCYVHRIAWALYYGCEPPDIIDHWDGNPANNRIANLREATDGLNTVNTRARKNSKSGMRGVHWSSLEGRWRSSFKSNGRSIHLGWFDTKEEAQESYQRAAKERFGEYSFYERAA